MAAGFAPLMAGSSVDRQVFVMAFAKAVLWAVAKASEPVFDWAFALASGLVL